MHLSSAVLGQTLLYKDAQMLDITQQRTQHSHVGRRILQLVGGPVSGRKTPRSQFPRACFFETSAEPSAAIRLRAFPELDQTVCFHAVCALMCLVVKCTLRLLSSDLPSSSFLFCLLHPSLFLSPSASLRCPSSALCLAFETALDQTFRDRCGGAMLGPTGI